MRLKDRAHGDSRKLLQNSRLIPTFSLEERLLEIVAVALVGATALAVFQ
jgi:hypothetical protein